MLTELLSQAQNSDPMQFVYLRSHHRVVHRARKPSIYVAREPSGLILQPAGGSTRLSCRWLDEAFIVMWFWSFSSKKDIELRKSVKRWVDISRLGSFTTSSRCRLGCDYPVMMRRRWAQMKCRCCGLSGGWSDVVARNGLRHPFASWCVGA